MRDPNNGVNSKRSGCIDIVQSWASWLYIRAQVQDWGGCLPAFLCLFWHQILGLIHEKGTLEEWRPNFLGLAYELDYLFMHLLNQLWMLYQGLIITMECGGKETSSLFSALTVGCSPRSSNQIFTNCDDSEAALKRRWGWYSALICKQASLFPLLFYPPFLIWGLLIVLYQVFSVAQHIKRVYKKRVVQQRH